MARSPRTKPSREPRNPHGQFEWVRRRRLIYAALAYCFTSGTAILIASLLGADSALLNTITAANYSLAGSILTAYIFGAVIDDHSERKFQLDAVIEPPHAPGTEPPEDFAG